jgi:hypothetical protein
MHSACGLFNARHRVNESLFLDIKEVNLWGSPKIMRNYEDPDLVSASEIASYAFCPEAWRLGSGLDLRPNNEQELSRGERIHEKTAVLERRSQSALRLAFVLLVIGLLILVLYLLSVSR